MESLTLKGPLGKLEGFDLYQTKINTDRIYLKSADRTKRLFGICS